jgi:hexosaminidase
MNNSEDIYEYFVDRVATITRGQARTPVQWVEVFEHFGSDLDKNTVIHVWKAKDTMTSVISAGYKALLSDNDLWYLDNLVITWDKMYQNEPTSLLDPTSDFSLLLGGEVCMWGETVDISDLDNTVWPRAAAVAERSEVTYYLYHSFSPSPPLVLRIDLNIFYQTDFGLHKKK